ncbi:hypothetical protein BgiBS90_011984 [Biomphalaria glabrata]|nr:hypothetical protein BgiBS90_011984 [Biomphalaria glabrata]
MLHVLQAFALCCCLAAVTNIVRSEEAESDPKPTCSPIMCLINCPNGFETNENGCNICHCKAAKKECSPVRCKKLCVNGFAKDKNGCEICRCKECPKVVCKLGCPNGWAKNEEGCDICHCKDQ